MDRHAGPDEGVHEGDRRREVGLIGGQHVTPRVAQCRIAKHGLEQFLRRVAGGAARRTLRRPRRLRCRLHLLQAARRHRPGITLATLDGVAAHPPDVDEELLPIPCRQIEHRAVGRQRVLDALPHVPGLRLNRKRQIGARQLTLRPEWNLHGRRIADRLGEQPDHVVEVHGGPQPAVPPRGVVRSPAHRHAGLVLGSEACVHRRADQVERRRNQRVVHVVERIAEGRREHDGADRARLVVVVHDLRVPLAVQHAVHVGGLGKRAHVRVAVVVVTRVLLVEPGQVVERSLEGIALAQVPVGDQVVAVRVRVHREDHHVVEDAGELRVIATHQLVHRLDQLLGTERLVGVQPAVDPHHGLALGGQRLRFGFGRDVLGQCQPARDGLQALQLAMVLWRGDDGHPL